MSMPDKRPCCAALGLFCEEAWAGIADKLDLSPRQMQVARCVVEGQGDREIVLALGVSWHTVQTHMERLHEKLGIQSRVGLATQVTAAYRAWRTESNPPAGCRENTRLESL